MNEREVFFPVPNNPLPLRIMDPVTKEDGIPAEAMTSGIRDAYRKCVLWGWNPPQDQRIALYWLSREQNLIVVVWFNWTSDHWPVKRQSYLRGDSSGYRWADIISPDVQDAIRNWLALGALAGNED